ncbi:MAG: acyl-CoA dehydrogenase family protein [Deltaproteobacteria bacterium]|nr:acyl-CoA dehydrogenase family protein [Deltaproteobacteria bacterium]
MDFDLSEEQRLIQETARRFAEREIAPHAKEYDRAEKYPREIVAKAAEVGLVAPIIPEEYGGPGFGFLEQALITEQLTRVDLGIGQVIEAAAFGSQTILFHGSPEQKAKYLPPLVTGQEISAGAFTEPDAGTDLAAARTRAVADGDDFIINGNKIFITNGTVCNFMIVFCLTDPDHPSRHQRHSLILVEADRPGVTASKIRGKMGIRASDTAEIAFENVRVPQSHLIGQPGQGFRQLMHFFDVTRTSVAAEAVGLAQGALDLALRYTAERTTFGRPLNTNQGLQFQLAEMATKIELARTMCYKTAWLVDQGRPDPAQNAMAKYFAAETAVWVVDKALQMHGGYGYIDEYDIQRFYRDAKILEIYEGAKEAEKITIARRLIG